ncbi:MAG TPA: alpha/beta hydrolase [Paucimonas sp.]|nr:alpha/beta hydrolase [Paucimonas sp.]
MRIYQGYTAEELDRQYNARATVPDVNVYLAEYAARSAACRARLRCAANVPYGDHPDELLDIFPAERPGSPVLIYFHGGYWRALSKDDSSFMAETFVRAGAAVVAVDYSLAPAATLDTIVAQCRRALAWTWKNIAAWGGDPGRIAVCGSSAGGHIVGMLLAPGWHAEAGVPEDIVAAACPVSGLFDLTPLQYTHINAWARLDPDAAARLSPLFHLPARGCPLLLAYGEHETAEFQRQSRDYLAAWRARGFAGECADMPGTNHFDVILKLAESESPLTRGLMRMMDLA